MDTVSLLQALLNEEGSYDELLESLHKYAKEELGSEGGLPMWQHPQEHMQMMVKEWLVKLILKVGD